jgi:hypothetical protein
LTKFASVVEWLEGIKMSRYVDVFERSGVRTLYQVRSGEGTTGEFHDQGDNLKR